VQRERHPHTRRPRRSTPQLTMAKTQQKREGPLRQERQRGLVLECSTSVNTVGRRFPPIFPCSVRLHHVQCPSPVRIALMQNWYGSSHRTHRRTARGDYGLAPPHPEHSKRYGAAFPLKSTHGARCSALRCWSRRLNYAGGARGGARLTGRTGSARRPRAAHAKENRTSAVDREKMPRAPNGVWCLRHIAWCLGLCYVSTPMLGAM
jgi:hypothetical protein